MFSLQNHLSTQAANQKAEDDAVIEEMRQKFGDQEAAKLAADLYKLRRSAKADVLGIFPRWLVVFLAAWLAVFDLGSRLPQLLLTWEQYLTVKIDYGAKNTDVLDNFGPSTKSNRAK